MQNWPNIWKEVQAQFIGKSIVITTSTFTEEAVKYASKIEFPKIVLIDGNRLAELMFEFDVGVSKEASCEVKKIDPEFFYG